MRILPLLAVLAIALAGCASQSNTTTTTTGMDHDHMHMMAKTVDVTLKGNKFVNDTVTVYQGDTVRWTHMDGMTPHNVVADDGSFDSNPNCDSTIPIGIPASQFCMVQGSAPYTHTFDKVGTVTYKCRVHANMKGTVVVRAHDAGMMM